MSETPSKDIETPNTFSPNDLQAPSERKPDISKVVYTHVSTLHGLIKEWKRIIVKGCKICYAISLINIQEVQEDDYPEELGHLTQTLLEITNGLKHVSENVETIKNQLEAISKLLPGNEPVIMSWPASMIFKYVCEISTSLRREYELKLCITENIAHCRDEKVAEIYVSAWEFAIYFNTNATEFLFAEMNLS
ncbi:hypothetical protein EVAR_59501_1 [Eumeta japonica]|uniref:Cyclin-dependent kinase 2-interacting protein n=1 Tax=Eumeta variegata TaxID=151549 RepID=A0A4C1YEM4_EUMVA|nr:hypothetical protein EVAR_59501_1 [Eumeta japonica]